MKFKYRALVLGFAAAMAWSGTAHAIQIAGEALEIYGTLYPELNYASYSDSSAGGTPLSTMTKGLVIPGTQVFAPGPASKDQVKWSTSYIGVKGAASIGDVRVAYNYEGITGKGIQDGLQNLFTDTRDAFVSIGHAKLGTLQVGQMDTIYKEYGDRVRMLGVSSANFTSTTGVLSGVGWKSVTKDTSKITSTCDAVTGACTSTTVTTGAAGTTSFNTRIGHQIRYESPVMNGFQAGISYRPDTSNASDRDQSLTAAALRWSNDSYYVAVQQEVHKDYRAFSGTDAVEKSTTVLNRNPHSKDTARRISFGYSNGPLKLGADIAHLEYTEAAIKVGKFQKYSTDTWQVSVDYALSPSWNLAANYASGSAGSCALLGGAVCSTAGQGGSLLSLGAKFNYNKNIGLFALYGLNTSNGSASYASSAIGGSTSNIGLGVLIKF